MWRYFNGRVTFIFVLIVTLGSIAAVLLIMAAVGHTSVWEVIKFLLGR